MKKLLLLALLPLTLTGCSDLEPTKKDFGWQDVKAGESITVYFGAKNDYRTYYNAEGGMLKYKLVTYETVAELFVKYKQSYDPAEVNEYYIGTNITVFYGEV